MGQKFFSMFSLSLWAARLSRLVTPDGSLFSRRASLRALQPALRYASSSSRSASASALKAARWPRKLSFTSGHNPRRFVAFNQQRYDAMKDAALRRRMAAIFQLTLDDSGLIDTSSSDASEKLIKVLCNKGMVDPFGNVPVEVSAVSRW